MTPLVPLILATWVSVTPETILHPVPEYQWTGTPGAVQPSTWRRAKPAEACPIYESGAVVGFSLGCTEKRRSAAVFPDFSRLNDARR